MRGVKYNCTFQNRDGTSTLIKEFKMRELLDKLEELLKKNYNIHDRLSNQVIYNLQFRPENASRLLKLFVHVERCVPSN
tara:strand:- start:373 stop:609 length:237 start_codon:yes stop_codon:yes gene_type:complete